jgi:RNA polymerase primary sigma factor
MRQLKISQQITQRSENSVNLYFQEVNKFPMISLDEEVELSVKIRNGDQQAMQKLVQANLRFVISVAKQYQNQGLSFPDLINEGNVGLVKAASRFDETRGFKFISYAVWWIRQSIMQAISEQTRIVRLPLNRLSTIKKITRAMPYLEQQLEREPTDSELAEYLDINEDVILVNNLIKNRQVSLDKPMTNDGNGDFTLYDIIETDYMPSPDFKLVADSVKTDLKRALGKLNNKEAEIITMSYGINNRKVHSLNEIAIKLNMSGERVRQIRNTGLLRLKKLLTGKTSYHNNL